MALQPAARRVQVPVKAAKGPLLLSDAVLSVLSKRADVLSAFPFMRLSVPGAPSGCSRCNRAAANRHASASEYERVKSGLTTLQAERITQLKSLLNASVIVFFRTTPRGTVKHVL